MYKKHLVTDIGVSLENGELYMNFTYCRSRLGNSGETCDGSSSKARRMHIESGVKDVEIAPPRKASTLTQKIFGIIRPRPYILILHRESETQYLPVSDQFATKCLFESRGMDNMWVVEHPSQVRFISTFS